MKILAIESYHPNCLIAESTDDLRGDWATFCIEYFPDGLSVNQYEIESCYVYYQKSLVAPIGSSESEEFHGDFSNYNSDSSSITNDGGFKIRKVFVPLVLHQRMISYESP